MSYRHLEPAEVTSSILFAMEYEDLRLLRWMETQEAVYVLQLSVSGAASRSEKPSQYPRPPGLLLIPLPSPGLRPLHLAAAVRRAAFRRGPVRLSCRRAIPRPTAGG